MTPALPKLPISDQLPVIANALQTGNRLVLSAPPGAGKTTRVPLALLDAPWTKGKKIIVLEPRRIAARASAERMAKTLGERPGETVGYRVRFGSKVSRATRIEVVTEGVFVRMILEDPELTGIAAVFFDEFHERSLDADFGLALAVDVQSALRPDLKLVVMSATLDVDRITALLDNPPVVKSEGRSYPVDITHRDRSGTERIEDVMTSAILEAHANEQGSILAFLKSAAYCSGLRTSCHRQVMSPRFTAIFPSQNRMQRSGRRRPDNAKSCWRPRLPKHRSPSTVSGW